jgi:hypothetical protein
MGSKKGDVVTVDGPEKYDVTVMSIII